MAAGMDRIDEMPVVKDFKDFDSRSGNPLERLVFNNRMAVLIVCALVTVILAWQAKKLVFNASFEKMIPQSHPYIKNYLQNKTELRGLGNSIRVVVENTNGDIFDPAYLDVLKQVNDELFLTDGVDRAWVKSLWTPSVRWNQVTEEGFQGGPVIPDSYDGSAQSLEQVRVNIRRSGIVGNLVANNFKSSLIFVPLLDKDPATGQRLDYSVFSKRLEELRAKFQTGGAAASDAAASDAAASDAAASDAAASGAAASGAAASGAAASGAAAGGAAVKIHVIGFAKLAGDLIDGLKKVLAYFGIAALIAAAVIFLYTRCWRSTTLVIACSLAAVLWQLGLVSTAGYELDPYSILVPFLVFAIGVSHGVQKMNGIMQDVGRGTHKLVAARYTFRRLFLAGLTALLADAVGFGVLMLIDIPVIQDLALSASIGVAILIFTNLLLLPVLLSFTGVSESAACRTLQEEGRESGGKGLGALWGMLDRFTERRWALGAVAVAALLAVVGFAVSLQLKIGDLDPGAPELRPASRYNLDNAFITANYSLSSDQFAVILKTPPEGCLKYESMVEADRLAWALQQVPGVQTTVCLTDAVRQITAGTFEGSPKWISLSRNQKILNFAEQQATTNSPDLFNIDGAVMPVVAYLTDHKAETLDRVVKAADEFARSHNTKDRQFLLAAGNAGIEAATNIVVREANRTMLLYVYAAVIVLCFVTFRSWRAVVVAVLPLMVTSILCEALMVVLGIGVKVATLPVIALGVGIGVDYALYLLSVQLTQQRAGLPLAAAYKRAVQFTGKVVGLVGITLAAGVVTWVFSPIKFQADMGILLTFMFLWNMIGALVLIPALSHFLLGGAAVPAQGTAAEISPGERGEAYARGEN